MAWKNDQVSREETDKIIEIAREAVGLPGDYVELGCYRGDTSLLLAEILKGTDKRLWINDSFEGLPDKDEKDRSALGVLFRRGELAVTKREVKERFLRAGLKVPIIKKGWFKDLTDNDLPEKIALAFLDGDFYESVRDSLRLVEDRIVEGGVIIIHDYNNPALPGVAEAVNEWIKDKNIKIKQLKSMAIIK